MSDPTREVLVEVYVERSKQDHQWGDQNHPDGTGRPQDHIMAEAAKILNDHKAERGTLTFRDILEEEVWEAYAETDPERLREELVQVAACAVLWVEALDRRQD